jgi:hypothetical protein
MYHLDMKSIILPAGSACLVGLDVKAACYLARAAA